MHHWAFGISVIGRLVVRIESHRIPFHVGPARQAHVQVVPALPVADVKGNAPTSMRAFASGNSPSAIPYPSPMSVPMNGVVSTRSDPTRYKSTVHLC